MAHQPTLTAPLPHHVAAPCAARAAHRRPGLAARGATLVRTLLVPGAAERIVRELDGGSARELRARRSRRAQLVAAGSTPARP